jgi:hypothetical protein
MAKTINLWISDHEDKIDRKIASEIEEKNLVDFHLKMKKLLAEPKTFEAVVNSKFFFLKTYIIIL